MVHASLHKPRIRGDAHRVGECTDEVAERQTTLASNSENRNAAAEIALHDLGCEPDLPGRECWSGVRSDMYALSTLSAPVWWRGRRPGLRLPSAQRDVYGQTFKAAIATPRSEEHTSELQSLMRTSYAVFCLTKNRIPYYLIHTTHDETTYVN